jgi:hypothetical protein
MAALVRYRPLIIHSCLIYYDGPCAADAAANCAMQSAASHAPYQRALPDLISICLDMIDDEAPFKKVTNYCPSNGQLLATCIDSPTSAPTFALASAKHQM